MLLTRCLTLSLVLPTFVLSMSRGAQAADPVTPALSLQASQLTSNAPTPPSTDAPSQSRALVPIGPRSDHPSAQGGSGDPAKPRPSHLPNQIEIVEGLDAKNKRRLDRKSKQLEQTKKWNQVLNSIQKKSDQLARNSKELATQGPLRHPVAATRKLAKGGVQMGGYLFAFGIAMGVMAAAELSLNYSENPRAWQAYVDSLTNPMGIAAFVGFMAASAPFLNKMAQQTKALPQMGYFMAGMAAGTIVSTLISRLPTDPEFYARTLGCLGFSSFVVRGTFVENQKFCEENFNKFVMTRGVFEAFVPVVGQVLLASGAFFGLSAGTQWLLMQQPLSRFLQTMQVTLQWMNQGPAKVLIRLSSPVVQITLFLGVYAVTEYWFPMEKKLKDWLLLDVDWGPSFYGNSLKASRDELLAQFALRAKSAWTLNPDSIPPDRLCYDKSRKAEQFYHCDMPGVKDLSQTILNDFQVRARWREQQLAPAKAIFEAWQEKTKNVATLLQVTYEFQNDLYTNGAPLFLDAKWLELKRAELAQDPRLKSLVHPAFVGEFRMRDWFDYLFINTALCGASVHREPNSEWSRRKYQDPLISLNRFDDLRFTPPTWSKPNSWASDLCGASAVPSSSMTVEIDPAKRDDPTWQGAFLRGELMAFQPATNEDFTNWWAQELGTFLDQEVRALANHYEQFLREQVHPRLLNDEWARCEATQSSLLPTVAELLQDFGTTQSSVCPGTTTHRVPLGVLPMIREDFKLYLALLATHPKAKRSVGEQQQLEASHALVELVEQMIAEVKTDPDLVWSDASMATREERFARLFGILKSENTPQDGKQKSEVTTPTKALEAVIELLWMEMKGYRAMLRQFK